MARVRNTLSKSNLYTQKVWVDTIEKYFCFKVKLIFVDRNNSIDDRLLLA